MKVSGFTITRNAIKYNYPILESIKSVLPICDEFIVNVGDSEDGTLDLIKSIDNNKIKIIQTVWDLTQGAEVLSQQTNLALKECTGDWALYLQSDEVIHERDLPKLHKMMQEYVSDTDLDALRFRWFHFYGSYYRYRVDSGWYQKQDRIIRNNGTIESCGDAFSFRRKDGKPINRKNTNCFLYHYGWVHPENIMMERRVNAKTIGFTQWLDSQPNGHHSYGDLGRFPIYFGTHPKVMSEKIRQHPLSEEDLQRINKQHWWNPIKWFKVRYKTGLRVRERIE